MPPSWCELSSSCIVIIQSAWLPCISHLFILQESPAWPVLVESCASRGIKMGLLNARMSSRAFLAWFQRRMSRALLQRMLTSFSLIVPQSDIVSVCQEAEAAGRSASGVGYLLGTWDSVVGCANS